MSWSAPIAMLLANLGVNALDAPLLAFLAPAFVLAVLGVGLGLYLDRRSTPKE